MLLINRAWNPKRMMCRDDLNRRQKQTAAWNINIAQHMSMKLCQNLFIIGILFRKLKEEVLGGLESCKSKARSVLSVCADDTWFMLWSNIIDVGWETYNITQQAASVGNLTKTLEQTLYEYTETIWTGPIQFRWAKGMRLMVVCVCL